MLLRLVSEVRRWIGNRSRMIVGYTGKQIIMKILNYSRRKRQEDKVGSKVFQTLLEVAFD